MSAMIYTLAMLQAKRRVSCVSFTTNTLTKGLERGSGSVPFVNLPLFEIVKHASKLPRGLGLLGAICVFHPRFD
jgi:hypothetical protein